jgi:hypothetical protein
MKQQTRLYLGLVILVFWSTEIRAAPACTAEYTINSENGNNFSAHVVVVNQRKKKLKSWKVAWKMPNGQQITSLNNGRYRQRKAGVVVGNLTGLGKIAAGASIAFDFEASYAGDNAAPDVIRLNGKKCAVSKVTLPSDTSCAIDYSITAQWNTGFTAAVKIHNPANAWSAWKLSWDMPDGQQITNLWNGQHVQNGSNVEVVNAGWNGHVAKGASASFGFQGTHTGANRIPGTFSLNGNVCSILAADGDSSNTVVPNVPAGFTGNVIDNARVALSWTDQSSNETGFRIERRKQGDADWMALATTAANVQDYTDSTIAMGSDYEYRLSAINAVGSSADSVLPISVPSLLDYGKLQYQRQGCGGCHGIDGNGGIAGALTHYSQAELSTLTATIAATMPPPADPAQCAGNCAPGVARYIIEVLALAGNGGTGNGQACSGKPPPGVRSLRLLTRQEYQNTVNDLLGLSANLIYQLPEENRVDGFDNNSATNQVTSIRLEAYLAQADTLASQAVLQNSAQLLPCKSQSTDCAQQFISSFGKRAYRRPLTAEETADFLNNFASVSFTDAVTMTISQMLVSPYFLYRSELGELQADGNYKLTPYETATALSYLFIGSMPDAALFAAADQNRLDTPEQRLTQAARLLGMPQSRKQLGNFVGQWLLSSSPYTLPEKDKTVYPRYTGDVKTALSEELIAFFNYVAFDSTQSFQELFTADYVLANKTLADYYGIAGPNGSAYQVTPVNDGSRMGLLTLGAVLSRYANSNESHPFKRGGFLYKRLLCYDLPLPANMGLIVAPKQDPNATTRERFAFHSSSNASCYSCHQYLDEPGFGFENYDGAGAYRTLENGQAIDTAGTLRGLETFTPTETVSFSNLQDISDLLAGSPQAAQCVARQYYRYGTGRREQPADSCVLDSFIETYANNGYNLQTMLLGIVNAPSFNLRSGSGL